jgi:hypothetical protein
MWINKFIGILAINQKSPKDITEGILFNQEFNISFDIDSGFQYLNGYLENMSFR